MIECDQQLIEKFEQIITLNTANKLKQVHSSNILGIQQGILQFDVEDKGLGQEFRVNLEQKSNKKVIFNNYHYPIHNDTIFSNLKTLRQKELKFTIEEEINQLDYEALIDGFDNKNLNKELENQFTFKSVDEFNISSKNPFSVGFQFNELTNELIDFNYEMINVNFKNFSSEGFTGKIFQISDKSSKVEDEDINYKTKKYLPYSNKVQIEQDFLDLANNIDEFCKQNDKHIILSDKQNLKELEAIKISGEQKVKMFNKVYKQLNILKVQEAGLFDFEKAQKEIKSQYESEVEKKKKISLVYKSKEINEIINQASHKLKVDQFTNESQDNKKAQNSLLQSIDQYQWAEEDNQDVSQFHDKLPKERMAIQYPFELDSFQKRSILRLEEGQNVFVCAHTSAGKTVVAEYSIALAKKHKRKAIYTSPIKALSNQKYRDFKKKFGDDVGIITGDVSLNPTASYLIVTTEVLRNMLYKGHDIVRDVAWVIFDEVHYVNNQDRGGVWEETIILLPEYIGLVMLSATVHNYMDFANWVGKTKQRKIYVEKTLHRPVPLEHSIYYDGKIFIIKSDNEGFNQENYEKINKYIKEQESNKKKIVNAKDKLKQEKKDKEIYKNTNLSQNAKAKQKFIQEIFIKQSKKTNLSGGNGPLTEAQQVKNVLKYCQKNELLPCVVFAFSKNIIKQLSESLGNLNLISHEESKQIEEFFNKASQKLKSKDLEVHQIRTLKDLMMRGIAVHHSGVIPFIKEIVEILFSKGLIKVLFATETFAIGINMPTKTVIFYSLKKFDSSQYRILNSSEYTQMSGRAGRRGLDLKGNVIILVTEPKRLPSKMELTQILDHKGEMLSSKFKITYELIMKLLSSRELDVTEMMKKSYSENDKYSQLPLNLKRIQEIQKGLKDIQQIVCPIKPLTMPTLPIEDFYQITQQMQQANKAYWSTETKYLQEEFAIPSYCQFIDEDYNDYLGLIVEFIKKEKYENYFVVMFAYEFQDKIVQPNFEKLGRSCFFTENDYKPYQMQVQKKDYIYELIELPARMISKIFDVGFDAKKTGLRNKDYLKNCVINLIYKMKNTYQDYRMIRNGKDLKYIKNKQEFLKDYKQVETESNQNDKAIYESFQDGYERSLCFTCNKKIEHFKLISQKNELQIEFDNLIKVLDEDDLAQHKNFQARLNLLKQLNYFDEDDLPQLKTRFAKEIDNIYVSELIVQGIFDELDEAEVVAILIGFVTQYNKKYNESDYDPSEDYENHGFQYSLNFFDAYTKTKEILNKIIQLEIDNEIIIVGKIEEALSEIFSPQLMKVAYEWVRGKDFLQVSLLTDVEEGSIILSMLRLDNLLKNIKNSAQYIGNNSLSLKIESCQEKMRRDIIFAQSLYLEEDNQ
ncbi:DEAD/DEAH-box helicase family protein (macronuclear) [Tetrahymena thermophila SB210]|uniref:DEAD/DEAH-box helicase family protein n=1 Tax=Tetrahymena thermophila (strain SB210) TaxID=312017 RepID=Q23RU3_TETTS|nr:DEAD/DEAH-box helicase family protein [Tetrahymena thermophila SB210]EAR99296.2 DEAD/DEAH-box helicase family protein [Tetrahymena thermophila SB210]|eukprot:XP_001019541.2 DEAD/DEAH-box helicase family protein [Tetrahymena thermophila SB210]